MIEYFYAQAEGTAGQSQMGGIQQFLPIILIIGVFYLFVFLPQSRRKKKLNKMKESLRKGQTVILSGGLIGKFQSFKMDGKVAVVELSKGINIEIYSGGIVDVPASPQIQKKKI